MPGNQIRVLGIIPARYKSSRFPGKPLVEICGVPMLKRTFQQAIQSRDLSELIVATDDQRIVDFCQAENMPVTMTSEQCLTGTDRLAEVALMQEYGSYDLYINIQGDEPVIDPKTITRIIELYQADKDTYIAYNLYKILDDKNEINSRTIIKVIVNENDELMYMSRLPIPYAKNNEAAVYRQQVPVYGYTSSALKIFFEHQKTINEIYEDIELLRFIDLGYKIKMAETNAMSVSVDVPDDIKKIEKILSSV